MDLRGSPAHENGSRSSSMQSQPVEFEANDTVGRPSAHLRPQLDPAVASELANQLRQPHKLDLYSLPVFCLELLILIGLAFSAYYIHFVHYIEPMVSGFYCDDINYRQRYQQSELTKQFQQPQNELTVLALLLATPISFIIFFELINSMFGALKFRKIKAYCQCCKLHSITRRSMRFCGAYILGFLFVSISCDILASSTGRLRPYFHENCSNAYQQCRQIGLNVQTGAQPALASIMAAQASATTQGPAIVRHSRPFISHRSSQSSDLPAVTPDASSSLPNLSEAAAGSQPIGSESSAVPLSPAPVASALMMQSSLPEESRIKEAVQVIERQWIDLKSLDYSETCKPKLPDEDSKTDEHQIAMHKYKQLAKSWPSYPAAVASYACLFLVFYLAYNGTARPVRIITSVLVLAILVANTMFCVQLVKDNYQHWDDAIAGTIVALVVVVFVLAVYLNRFRDTHYYERQKMHSIRDSPVFYDLYRAFGKPQQGSGVAYGDYQVDKVVSGSTRGLNMATNNNIVGASSNHINNVGEQATYATTAGQRNSADYNNDLAMRYFQIPRANYRGSPRG